MGYLKIYYLKYWQSFCNHKERNKSHARHGTNNLTLENTELNESLSSFGNGIGLYSSHIPGSVFSHNVFSAKLSSSSKKYFFLKFLSLQLCLGLLLILFAVVAQTEL